MTHMIFHDIFEFFLQSIHPLVGSHIGAVHILRNAKIANFGPPSPYETNNNSQANPPKVLPNGRSTPPPIKKSPRGLFYIQHWLGLLTCIHGYRSKKVYPPSYNLNLVFEV